MASIATWVTPSATNQPRSFSSSAVKVVNSFTCWWRPLGPRVRTAAITVFLVDIQGGATIDNHVHGHLPSLAADVPPTGSRGSRL